MAGRGAQTFQKRQKEQQRKEKQQEKFAKRLERKRNPEGTDSDATEPDADDLSWLEAPEPLPTSDELTNR